MVKEHPIIFSSEMVKAILEDRKTMTRRMIKPQPILKDSEWTIGKPKFGKSLYWKNEYYGGFPEIVKECPYGQFGDRLWVRETFHSFYFSSTNTPSVIYKDGMQKFKNGGIAKFGYSVDDRKWHPSIHMPHWASRITLEITNIKVEKLQEISEEDAIMEGVIPYECSHQTLTGRSLKSTYHYKRSFVKLWDFLNAKIYPWSSNPWVWVIEFKRVYRVKEKGGRIWKR